MFSPLSLAPFIWLDPSDLTTLFQERTGASATTPAEVDGVVGTMLDKSGNGRHVIAPSDAARPILRNSGSLYWLETDGIDDALTTGVVGAAAQPVEMMTAFRRISSAFGSTDSRIASHPSHQGSLNVGSGNDGLALFAGATLGTLAYTINTDAVASYRFNGVASRLGVDNGAYLDGDAGAQGIAGATLGANEEGFSGFTNCRFYGHLVFDRLLTDPEIASLRTYLAAKQGRVL